ncbi:MAG: hypothetical protein JNJ71_03115, partial [Rubrivivax sp.]|nr:hypothetical protein [Rubrivivax sp.]
MLGARTILLDALLDVARAQGDEEALRQLAVSSLPMTPGDLAHALSGTPAQAAQAQAVAMRLDRLASLSLVTPVAGGHWVHRWTSEALGLSSETSAQQARCRRAGEFRLARGGEQGIAYDDIREATYNFLDAGEFEQACALALQICEFHAAQQQTIAAVVMASEALARLPPSTAGWAPLADVEVQGSMRLGLTERALARTREVSAVFEQRVAAEPGRADYQRGLSVSYSKLGDLMSALGQGEQAREFFEKSLAIRKRLAEAEPGRADYQRDLSVS